MNPVVSVLVTVFNREAYLAACLDSILASTWQDFEVVVVDDGSTDQSVAIAQRYARLDPRIRFWRNESNLGDYPNRNRSAALARGRYLKYVDADDVLYPHSLAIMAEAMHVHREAALGLSWNVIDPPQPYPFISTPKEIYQAHFLGRSLLGVGPSGAIIRRDAFEITGGFSGQQFVGDTDLWLRLAARWPVVSLPPALVWWRRHEGQQMTFEQGRHDVLNTRYRMESEAFESSRLLGVSERQIARGRLRHRHARKLLSLALRQGRPALAWRLFRASGLTFPDLVRGMSSYR